MLENGTDPDGDELTATLVSDPQNGTLTFDSDGSFEYVPHAAFHGSDSFLYPVSDGIDSDEATVTILVEPAPSQPATQKETANTHYCSCSCSCDAAQVSTNEQVGALQAKVFSAVSYARGVPVFYDASTLDENQGYRFALQADATLLATGRHPWQMTVTEHLLDGNGNPLTRLQTFEGVHHVHSRAESVFGNRWEQAYGLVDTSGGLGSSTMPAALVLVGVTGSKRSVPPSRRLLTPCSLPLGAGETPRSQPVGRDRRHPENF